MTCKCVSVYIQLRIKFYDLYKALSFAPTLLAIYYHVDDYGTYESCHEFKSID